jgi:hypothetical protein
MQHYIPQVTKHSSNRNLKYFYTDSWSLPAMQRSFLSTWHRLSLASKWNIWTEPMKMKAALLSNSTALK